MRVESKFLTADVRIVSVQLHGRRLVVEGLVKGFLPMRVEVGPEDLRVLLEPLRQRLHRLLPEAVKSAIGDRNADPKP